LHLVAQAVGHGLVDQQRVLRDQRAFHGHLLGIGLADVPQAVGLGIGQRLPRLGFALGLDAARLGYALGLLDARHARG
ncbi:hypothetical protein Q6280_28670, partial [Klebsiella pneumoniae]|uniref:hypothetical protein n=1 Tax=Klebsiella pneumoniae TaxID=573 RepID=UPI002730A472